MECYSAMKKNKIMPFAATWMDLEIIILSEVSQTEKRKYHITHMWNLILKMIQMNLFTKQKQTYRYQKETYGYQGETWGRRDKLGGWD